MLFQSRFILFRISLWGWNTTTSTVLGHRNGRPLPLNVFKISLVLAQKYGKFWNFQLWTAGQLFHDVLSWSRENNRKIKNHFSPKDVSYNWTKSHRVSVVSADYSSSNRWKAGGWAEKYFGIILVTVCDRWTLSGRSLSYYFFVSNKDCPSFVTLRSGKVWLLG